MWGNSGHCHVKGQSMTSYTPSLASVDAALNGKPLSLEEFPEAREHDPSTSKHMAPPQPSAISPHPGWHQPKHQVRGPWFTNAWAPLQGHTLGLMGSRSPLTAGVPRDIF